MIYGEVKRIGKSVDRLGEALSEHRAEFAEHEGRDEARHAAMIDRVSKVENKEEVTGRHQIVELQTKSEKITERVFQFVLGIILAIIGALGGYLAGRK